MFRSSQFPAWVCPIRSSLLLRESCLFTSSEHATSGQQGGRHVKDRRYEQTSGSKDGSLSPSKTLHYTAQLSSISSGKDKYHLTDFPAENRQSKVNSSSPHQCLQVFAKTKQVLDCLINRTFYQQWRRPWGFSQSSLSCINKTPCNFLQIHQHHRWLSANPFSLTTWISGRFPWKSEPFSPSIHQSRAVHQAAPRVTDTWRDCLSPENESRCRQSLESNWKLYEMNKVRKGASQVQGQNQGKWASILVSLCSVEGEPAFLFTLRSSTLKGRHKGDVRLVKDGSHLHCYLELLFRVVCVVPFLYYSCIYLLLKFCWWKERSSRQRCGGHSIAGSPRGAWHQCGNRQGLGHHEASAGHGELDCFFSGFEPMMLIFKCRLS